MDTDSTLIGSPITLAELKAVGEFVRWQDLKVRVASLLKAKRLPNGYPLVPSRLPASGNIDLYLHPRWQQVKFVRVEGSLMGGDRRIVYLDKRTEKSVPYNWFAVAPAGHFTAWKHPRPKTFAGAKLLDSFELAQHGHIIHTQELVEENWPYLTFQVKSFHPDARWVDAEDMWVGKYTVHAADPRVKVEGIVPREPWFNSTIAVSHRWMSPPDHPDPNGDQYRELLAISERLGLHDNQAFLIDYCSLPQPPHRRKEEAWFKANLPGFQAQFKGLTIVLNTGSTDYSKRAWCMLELMLAAITRSKPSAILNHDALDESLRHARHQAESYLQQSVWNQQGMQKAFAAGLTTATFNKWASDPVNVAIYNARIEGRNSILKKFERELLVTKPEDTPIIVKLLKQLAFGESGD